MDNQNEYLNEDVVLEEEELETSEDTSEDSDSAEDDSVTVSKAELNKLKRKAIAYDVAKTKTQETKPAQKQVINNNTNNTAPSIEETVLKAQGIEEEEIDMLKKIAQVSGTSLIDAQKDTMFKLWKEKKEQEQRSKKASMGASKGSSAKTEKGFNTPGLSEAEFKELWKQKMGR